MTNHAIAPRMRISHEIQLRFKSGNAVPVQSCRITLQEFMDLCREIRELAGPTMPLVFATPWQSELSHSKDAEAERVLAYASGDKKRIEAAHARCANTQDNLIKAIEKSRKEKSND